MPRNCCQNVRNEPEEKAVSNLPAIASLKILAVSDFTWHWDLRKPIGSFALEKICRAVVLWLFGGDGMLPISLELEHPAYKRFRYKQ